MIFRILAEKFDFGSHLADFLDFREYQGFYRLLPILLFFSRDFQM